VLLNSIGGRAPLCGLGVESSALEELFVASRARGLNRHAPFGLLAMRMSTRASEELNFTLYVTGKVPIRPCTT
jgi:hypothetical protein